MQLWHGVKHHERQQRLLDEKSTPSICALVHVNLSNVHPEYDFLHFVRSSLGLKVGQSTSFPAWNELTMFLNRKKLYNNVSTTQAFYKQVGLFDVDIYINQKRKSKYISIFNRELIKTSFK